MALQPKPPLSTSQIGIDADGVMWLATPSGMEPAGGGGGGLDPQAPPGAPGELQIFSLAHVGFDNSFGYDLVMSEPLPAGSWRVFGAVSGQGLSGIGIDLGLHLNFGDSFAQALASGSGNDGATKTSVVTLAGGQTVYLKAQTDITSPMPMIFSIITQRIN